MSKSVNIFCNGDSLKEAIDVVNKSVPGIAVNKAIEEVSDYVNYWIFLDKVYFLREMLPEARVERDEITLVTTDSIEQEDKFEKLVGFNIDYIPAGHKRVVNALGFGKGINWLHKTTFAAMAYSAMIGADQINIYGNDMSGEPYNENYWRRFRKIFYSAQSVMSRNGITVINY